jgi:hypothetical protein
MDASICFLQRLLLSFPPALSMDELPDHTRPSELAIKPHSLNLYAPEQPIPGQDEFYPGFYG